MLNLLNSAWRNTRTRRSLVGWQRACPGSFRPLRKGGLRSFPDRTAAPRAQGPLPFRHFGRTGSDLAAVDGKPFEARAGYRDLRHRLAESSRESRVMLTLRSAIAAHPEAVRLIVRGGERLVQTEVGVGLEHPQGGIIGRLRDQGFEKVVSDHAGVVFEIFRFDPGIESVAGFAMSV